ncbi:MAG: hypothetical protein ACSLFE_00460 [Gemmatimonadaceae bacterium]
MTISRAWHSATSLLRGEDGRFSFSKVVLSILVGGWLAGRTLEAALALVFLLATYGYRGLRLHVTGKDAEE